VVVNVPDVLPCELALVLAGLAWFEGLFLHFNILILRKGEHFARHTPKLTSLIKVVHLHGWFLALLTKVCTLLTGCGDLQWDVVCQIQAAMALFFGFGG
jgi:hypothetical protein